MGFGEIVLDEALSVGLSVRVTGGAFEALKCWGPRPGEAVTVVGQGGVVARARVTGLEDEGAGLFIFEEAGRLPGVRVEVMLLQALPEKERLELIIQKATELGVDSILPYKSGRSISIEERDSPQMKSHRWPDVARKAARQSRRPDIPDILPYSAFSGALGLAEGCGLRILLWERQGPEVEHIRDILHRELARFEGTEPLKVAVLNGPEGGFTEKEAAEAEGAGFIPVTLGPRILRTETAAIIAVGLITGEAGV